MKVIVVGECSAANVLRMEDPTVPSEEEFTTLVVGALKCIYPQYVCVPFEGTFTFDERSSQPDLAMVARDLSHWFVIEVELLSHSLEGHVLPQVRVLRYGEPNVDCIGALSRALGVDEGRAKTLLTLVPRSVVVVANRRDETWEDALLGLDAQFVAISFYTGPKTKAFEIDGHLRVAKESLGFGSYSATDRAIRLPATTRLGLGDLQMEDPDGFCATWTSRKSDGAMWITRKAGDLGLPDRTTVQIMRTCDNRIVLRPLTPSRVEGRFVRR